MRIRIRNGALYPAARADKSQISGLLGYPRHSYPGHITILAQGAVQLLATNLPSSRDDFLQEVKLGLFLMRGRNVFGGFIGLRAG